VSAQSQQFLKWSLRIVVVASFVCCLWSDIYREYFDPSTANNRHGYALWQHWIEEWTFPGRGIFLQYDFRDQGKNPAFAQTIYFLGVYCLYPQRPLVADPSILINDGHDILKNNSYPSEQWLMDHGVSSIMTIVMDPRRDLPVIKSVYPLGQPSGPASNGG